MQRAILLIALTLVSIDLGGCAVDANTSYVPDFIKQPIRQPVVEKTPDVGAILKTDVNAVFLQGSSPSDIHFSAPVVGKYGGWDTCVRGDIVGVTGKPLGAQTFLVNIDRGHVGRRERVGLEHWCARQTYAPL